MTGQTIPIANIYYLLCYAWKHIDERNVVRIHELKELNQIYDLLGKVLAEGVLRLFRGGLDRGYIEVGEDLAGIRGKIDVGQTVKRAVRAKGRISCNYEDMTPDVIHNRILRSTLMTLLRCLGMDWRVREVIRRAFSKFSGVSDISLNRRTFQLVQLDRNRRYYWFLLSVCRLIHEQLSVDESSGHTRFSDFTEEQMAKLFEDFVIGFYQHEQIEFKVNGSGRAITWNDDGTSESQRSMIPRMEADVILEAPHRRLILDAKYYSEALSGRFGGKLRSSHLYQLLAYLRNREAKEGVVPKHEGILLYPTVDRPLSIDVRLEGFRVRARSIDLSKDWREIHDAMLSIIS